MIPLQNNEPLEIASDRGFMGRCTLSPPPPPLGGDAESGHVPLDWEYRRHAAEGAPLSPRLQVAALQGNGAGRGPPRRPRATLPPGGGECPLGYAPVGARMRSRGSVEASLQQRVQRHHNTGCHGTPSPAGAGAGVHQAGGEGWHLRRILLLGGGDRRRWFLPPHRVAVQPGGARFLHHPSPLEVITETLPPVFLVPLSWVQRTCHCIYGCGILWSLMHSCLNHAQWLLVFYEFCCAHL